MKKTNHQWKISELLKHFKEIEFPEYQREPTVWDLPKKRMLIDSILRNYDIASIYLHRRDDGGLDCIDGRQRINAIASFLGMNDGQDGFTERRDNAFVFRSSDELFGTDVSILRKYDGMTWNEMQDDPKLRTAFLDYEINVIEMTKLDREEDVNLMFLRLQLGSPLNAGEKLNAMRGDMKEFVFGELAAHEYFDYLKIPKRRYSKQLTAAQIALNYFRKREKDEYARARFLDLQEFFKEHGKMNTKQKKIASDLKEVLTAAKKAVSEAELVMHNRALGITMVFIVNTLKEQGKSADLKKFMEFAKAFLKTLKEQVGRGIDIEQRYRDLLKFQAYVSQAAVERYAVENRETFLLDYFKYYKENGGKIKTSR